MDKERSRITETLVRRAKLGIYWFGESPNSGRLSKPPISSVALLLVTVIVKRTQRLYRP